METTEERDYARLTVTRWDGENVYGHLADTPDEETTVCYAQGNAVYNFNWTYLKDLLREGMQLNLVRPRTEGGRLYPELIIVEPDYLVDVSNVASCFAPYAESPLVSLLNKLAPAEKTSAILLGLMASQLLDEELHDDHHTYADCVRAFFRGNAMAILGADMETSFHKDAQAQWRNIHCALTGQLPSMVAGYDRRQVLVEPSFVCEMLGLQGRMDFLQLDMSILIEQKSGKAGFVPGKYSYRIPRQREEHSVQMLLYMVILRYGYRRHYEQSGIRLRAFLLYSKYTNPLLAMEFEEELLFRAIRLRNRIAAQDMRFADEGFGVLTELTADSLNEKDISGKLWDKYIRPRLDAILSPIKEAPPLERLYYLRMLRFVATEHRLAKLASPRGDGAGFACLWHDTLDEKLAAGNIYHALRLLSPSEPGGKVDRVTLQFRQDNAGDTSNFRTGDIVLLYPYAKGAQPDVRRTIVFRGTLASITASELVVSLRNEQTDAYVFMRDRDKLWAVEHDLMEASYSSLYANVQALLSAPPERRDLLMLRRPPEVDVAKRLRGDYGEFNEMVLRAKQARDMFLIIGPPGTGKTSFGMLHTLREELAEPDASVLVMAYTNRAVDEICGKLHGSVDFVRIGGWVSCAEAYRGHLLAERLSSCGNLAELRRLIMETRVFVGTVHSLSSCTALFKVKPFSLAIIDEASQILEPHIVGLLSARHNGQVAIRKFVMIGDHKQLPAVVRQRPEESAVSEPELREIGLKDCRLSLFERLLTRYRDRPDVVYMLTRQGRMHPEIATYASRAFYHDRLRAVPLPHQTQPSPSPRVRFIDVPEPGQSPSDKVNTAEAAVIAAVVKEIYDREKKGFSAERTVGVIVPYRNQIATVRCAIDNLKLPALCGITIDTVERYQGSQRRCIVYGFTVRRESQLNFLTDSAFVEDGIVIDRKLNVAITRAEEYLVLVGNSRILRRNALFAKLIDHIASPPPTP